MHKRSIRVAVMAVAIVTALTGADRTLNAWAGPGQIVTLAQDRTFPAATDPSTCKVFDFDPIEMGKFSRLTFVGKGTPLQFSIIYLFSLEPVKFSVPAPSGTGLGGQCDAIPAHDVFPPNNQFGLSGLPGTGPLCCGGAVLLQLGPVHCHGEGVPV